MSTIDIKTTAVDEEVSVLTKEIEKFQELSDKYMKICDSKLSTWVSPNKRALDEAIKNSKPAFDEAVEVITSYKNVAGRTVALINEAEREINAKLMG